MRTCIAAALVALTSPVAASAQRNGDVERGFCDRQGDWKGLKIEFERVSEDIVAERLALQARALARGR